MWQAKMQVSHQLLNLTAALDQEAELRAMRQFQEPTAQQMQDQLGH
jgi:hypothetical protein